MPHERRPNHCMDRDLHVGVGPNHTPVHTTLKNCNYLVPTRAHDPFAEQLEQIGVATLFDQ